jgi:hypothetical protein
VIYLLNEYKGHLKNEPNLVHLYHTLHDVQDNIPSIRDITIIHLKSGNLRATMNGSWIGAYTAILETVTPRIPGARRLRA